MKWLFASAALALLCTAMAPAASADEVRDRLEALAARGNGEAAYHLAMIYHLGLNGVTRDPRRALELFRASAAAGDPLGAYKLGCYYAGQGEGLVEPDPELALRYKLIAAEAGYALGQSDVARIYYDRGDQERALRWLNAAARQGGVDALAALAAYFSGEIPGVTARPDRVRQHAFTMLAIRRLSESGGPPVDPAEMEAELRRQIPTTPAELAEAQALIAGWRFEPSPVTLRAAQGHQAAEALARRSGS